MLWLKAFHIIFVVTWFAGLFICRGSLYTTWPPRTRSASSALCSWNDASSPHEHRALLALAFGIAMIAAAPSIYTRVAAGEAHPGRVLIGYHLWCRRLITALALRRPTHSARWFRWFNEVPSLLLIAIVILAVVKPALR